MGIRDASGVEFCFSGVLGHWESGVLGFWLNGKLGFWFPSFSGYLVLAWQKSSCLTRELA